MDQNCVNCQPITVKVCINCASIIASMHNREACYANVMQRINSDIDYIYLLSGGIYIIYDSNQYLIEHHFVQS